MRYLHVGHVMRAVMTSEETMLLRSIDDAFGIVNDKLDRVLENIHHEEDFMEASQDVLLDAFNQLDSSVGDLVSSEAAGAQEIANLAEVIKNLSPGTALTADQISSLASQATSAAQSMRDAVSSAQQTSTPPPDPAPEPTPSQEPPVA